MASADVPPDVFRAAFEAAPLPMALLDEDGVVIHVNPALGAVAGDEVVAVAGRELLGADAGARDTGAVDLVAQLRSGALPVAHVEGRLTAADGSTEAVTLGVRALDGALSGYLLAYVEDVARGGARDRLPSHDPATGLVNAAVLADLLRLLLADPAEDGVAVLHVAVQDPADLRARYGPAVADYLLVEVGRRLAGMLRAGDTGAAYGDGVFVLVAMAESAEAAAAMRDRVARTCATPHELADRQLPVPVRVGVAFTLTGPTAPAPDDLLSAAEATAAG